MFKVGLNHNCGSSKFETFYFLYHLSFTKKLQNKYELMAPYSLKNLTNELQLFELNLFISTLVFTDFWQA